MKFVQLFSLLSVLSLKFVYTAKFEDTCFSYRLGYPCCEGDMVVITDNDGQWGVEDDQWCGFNDDKCLGKYGYKACETTNEVVFTDNTEWGVENDEWCVICKEQSTTNTSLNYAYVLSQLGEDKNFAYSPESLFSALQMYEKCITNTNEKQEIINLLGNKNYLNYKSSKTSKLLNRIWIDTNKKYNFSSVKELEPLTYAIEMRRSDATAIKDKYVNEQTEGFIPSTPTKFNDDTVFDFMNVLYFKDKWNKNYNEFIREYRGLRFQNIDGDYKFPNSIYFTQSSTYYLRGNDAIAYSLKYEKNDYQMIVILPNTGKSIGEIDITPYLPNASNPATKMTDFDKFYFEMPEFSVENTWTLKPGSEVASLFGLDHFSGRSLRSDLVDLSGRLPPSAEISQIVKVECDKDGTKAAAVTEVHVTAVKGLPRKEPVIFRFICNRPYIYVLYDNVNNDVAFVGQVMKLEDGEEPPKTSTRKTSSVPTRYPPKTLPYGYLNEINKGNNQIIKE